MARQRVSGTASRVRPGRSEALRTLGDSASEVARRRPRRVVTSDPFVAPPKPGPEDTPYRSRVWALGRNSADGNDYRPGEPVPYAEALRQGIVAPVDGRSVTKVRIPRTVCGRCGGTGKFTEKKPPGHAVDCRCLFCGPCSRCGGSGYEPVPGGSA